MSTISLFLEIPTFCLFPLMCPGMATPSLMLYEFCRNHCRPLWVRMSYDRCLCILPWATGTVPHLLDAFHIFCAAFSDAPFPLPLPQSKFLHTGQVFLYSPSFPKPLFRVLLVLKSSLSHIIGTLFSERQGNFFTEMHALLICLSNLHQLLYHCIAAARIQVL